MYTLTAADFADTGQWRLLLQIRQNGLEAFLVNTLHKELEPQELCKVDWEGNTSEILKQIEEAVYNHPRLLDDFATRIIIYDIRTLLIPKEIAESTAGAEEELYNLIYQADDSDIITDSEGEITAAWSPGRGVRSFLMRTFPGARITCNLLEKIRKIKGSNTYASDGEDEKELKIFKWIRATEVDMILLEGNNLLSASTHFQNSREDIDRLEWNLIDAYNLDSTEIETIEFEE